MLSFKQLREANLSRCKRWHPGGIEDWSLSDWAIAMMGEAGEALNIVKKLNRSRDGITGNTKNVIALREDLAEELTDTIIYIDLLAARAGVSLEKAMILKFNTKSEEHGFPERLKTEEIDIRLLSNLGESLKSRHFHDREAFIRT